MEPGPPPRDESLFSRTYLEETVNILRALEPAAVERLALGLAQVRDGGGRLFVLGVGGSAGHAEPCGQ